MVERVTAPPSASRCSVSTDSVTSSESPSWKPYRLPGQREVQLAEELAVGVKSARPRS